MATKNGPAGKTSKVKTGSYCSKGHFHILRVHLGSPLASYPSAYVLFDHMLGWANFQDNETCKRGELPMGDRDMARRLGWGSCLTVTRARNHLLREAFIKQRKARTGEKRGTIITIIDYERYQKDCRGSQSDLTAQFSGSLSDLTELAPRSESDPGISPRSQSDPSVIGDLGIYRSLLLPELFSYLSGLSLQKRKKELAGLNEILKTHEQEQVLHCLQYVLNRQVPSGKTRELRKCIYPLLYVSHNFEWVADQVKAKMTPIKDDQDFIPYESEESLEEMENSLKELEAQGNGYTAVLRNIVEKKRAKNTALLNP